MGTCVRQVPQPPPYGAHIQAVYLNAARCSSCPQRGYREARRAVQVHHLCYGSFSLLRCERGESHTDDAFRSAVLLVHNMLPQARMWRHTAESLFSCISFQDRCAFAPATRTPIKRNGCALRLRASFAQKAATIRHWRGLKGYIGLH